MILLFCGMGSLAWGQQVLFSEPFNYSDGTRMGVSPQGIPWNVNCPGCIAGDFYEVRGNRLESQDTNGPATFETGNIDITNCSRLRVQLSYSGTPYGLPPDEMMESVSACVGCAGDPYNSVTPDCSQCWDFTLVELFYNDGQREIVEYIGVDFIPSFNDVDYETVCLENKTSVRLRLRHQSWANHEQHFFDDIIITCNQSASRLRIESGDADPEYCNGETVNFNAGGSGFSSFEWQDPSGNTIGSENSIVINANTAFTNPQTYTLIGTDASGCRSSETRNILVYPEPIADISIPATNICEGQPINLREIGGDGTSWAWSGPASFPSSTSQWTIPSAATDNSGSYSVLVTDGNECTASDQITLRILPAGNIPVRDTFVCITGNPIALPTQVGAVNGNWREEGAVNNNVFDPTVVGAGTYTITFIPDDTNCLLPAIATVEVYDGPEIFPVSMPLEQCGTGTADFYLSDLNEALNGNSGLDVLWFADNMLTTSLTDTFNTGSTTIYAVVVDGAGCLSQSVEVDLILTDGPDIDNQSTVESCNEYVLPNITGSGLTGNQAYYSESGGMGEVFLPGSVITGDTILYVFDGNTECFDEEVLTISIVSEPNAGNDMSISLCATSILDLHAFKEQNADSGFFTDENGVVVSGDSIDSEGLNEITRIYNYITDGSGVCNPDTAVIELIFFDEAVGMLNNVLCPGEFVVVNGNIYDEMTPSGQEILLTLSQNGCDSIVLIDLTFDSEIRVDIRDIYCGDQDIVINNTIYNSQNPFGMDTISSVNGCDSILSIDLLFLPIPEGSVDTLLCPGSALLINGVTFDENNTSGSVAFPGGAVTGCDSIVNVIVTYDVERTAVIDDVLCLGEERIINGVTYNASNPRGTEIVAVSGNCDSIYMIDLQILMPDTLLLGGIFCRDTSFVVGGVTYGASNPIGEEVLQGTAANGCDQYVFIDLDFLSSQEVFVDEQLCVGDFLVVNGNIYDETNPNGQEILSSANGCDSIVNVSLDFIGIGVEIDPLSPYCSDTESGQLYIDIISGVLGITAMNLDGNNVLDDFQMNDTLFDIPIGIHELQITDAAGCESAFTFEIENTQTPDFEILVNGISDKGYQLGFKFQATANAINWYPATGLSCTNCPDPFAIPETGTTYYLLIQDSNGCKHLDSVYLEYLFLDVYYKPNIFSPNEDGINDIFYIDARDVLPFSGFEIFDRWGNRVFDRQTGLTGNLEDGWDGMFKNNKALEGVYFYYLTLELPEGPRLIRGDFMLVR